MEIIGAKYGFEKSILAAIFLIFLPTESPLERTQMLSPEIICSSRKSVLCWLATADAQGQPNVSPKEIFTLYDAKYLLIANIASPRSVRNIAANPRVCVSFIDIFVQQGFKVSGLAQNILKPDADYEKWAAPLNAMAGPRFPIRSVILIQATACERILAPSYQLYPDQTTEQGQTASAMRAYGVQPLVDRS